MEVDTREREENEKLVEEERQKMDCSNSDGQEMIAKALSGFNISTDPVNTMDCSDMVAEKNSSSTFQVRAIVHDIPRKNFALHKPVRGITSCNYPNVFKAPQNIEVEMVDAWSANTIDCESPSTWSTAVPLFQDVVESTEETWRRNEGHVGGGPKRKAPMDEEEYHSAEESEDAATSDVVSSEVAPAEVAAASAGNESDEGILEWEEHQAIAKPLTHNVGKGNADIYKLLSTGRVVMNPKTAKVIKPKDGDEFVFTDVNDKEIPVLAKRDLYKWRYVMNKPNYFKNLRRTQFCAETSVPMTYTNLFKKVVYYDPDTKRAHVRYEGDNKWGLISDQWHMEVNESEMPQGEKIEPNPIDCAGATKAKYVEYYNNKYPPNATEPVFTQPSSAPHPEESSTNEEEDREHHQVRTFQN